MPERITHLRRLPDLGGLEPELLELAMQMSLQSRDLRDIPPTLGYELQDGGTQPNVVPMPKK
ncbi:hypothetical protein [uncultured Thioclava sp.]|uniref:hypothetical protein n=1 Tax=uncultured Thioclava sp. TaxID=473858 RepID=UPI0025F9845B|nr:hypothetical protein [uncultured Thioclava sp.]